MQFRHHLAQHRPVGGVDGARDLLDERMTQMPLVVPHRETVEHGAICRLRPGLGNVDILGHAAPRRFDRSTELV